MLVLPTSSVNNFQMKAVRPRVWPPVEDWLAGCSQLRDGEIVYKDPRPSAVCLLWSLGACRALKRRPESRPEEE